MLLAVVTGSVLGGCSDFFGSSAPRPTLDAVKSTQPREIVVTAGAGFIRFEGHLTTPVECQEMKAELDQYSESNGVIDIVVIATALDGCPAQQQTTWNYVGTLTSVPAGDYAVTVRHRFENQEAAAETVFQGQLTVSER